MPDEESFVEAVELVADEGKAQGEEGRPDLVGPARTRSRAKKADLAVERACRGRIDDIDELEAGRAGLGLFIPRCRLPFDIAAFFPDNAYRIGNQIAFRLV